jgi:signal transduction histidine kinase
VAERSRTLALVAALTAAGLGFVAEAAAGAPRGTALAVADLGVGIALVSGGALAWMRRPASRVGIWMWAGGVAWFLGTFGWPFVFLHRGPLVQLHLSYPSGRLPTSLARAVVGLAYLDAIVTPLARDDRLTIALSALVALTAARVFLGSAGPGRKAASPALLAALLFASVLSLGAVLRVAGVAADTEMLWAYDLAIAAIAVVLVSDLMRARWSQAALTGLVVDLDELAGPTTLQSRLARALGDPSLVVASWSPAADGYVDESGRAVPLPPDPSTRMATPISDDGRALAVIVHDRAILADAALLASAASLARVALANGHLHSAVQVQLREIAASRRRLVEAADAERRRLERLLSEGPARRLQRVSSLLAEADAALAASGPSSLHAEVEAASAELSELANGVRPASLASGGLAVALPGLAARAAPIAVSVEADVGRLADAIEAAAYFVCSEALANAAKHAHATTIRLRATVEGDELVLEVADDGAGGADPHGPGLRGLTDRVEALGGSLRIESEPALGTRIVARCPLAEASAR